MSKQLSIAAAFSVFAMAALALHAATPGGRAAPHAMTGAPIAIEAPVELPQLPALPALPGLAD